MARNPLERRPSALPPRTVALVLGGVVALSAAGGAAWVLTQRHAPGVTVVGASRSLVPLPAEVVDRGGAPFELTASSRIVADGAAADAAEQLAALLSPGGPR